MTNFQKSIYSITASFLNWSRLIVPTISLLILLTLMETRTVGVLNITLCLILPTIYISLANNGLRLWSRRIHFISHNQTIDETVLDWENRVKTNSSEPAQELLKYYKQQQKELSYKIF